MFNYLFLYLAYIFHSILLWYRVAADYRSDILVQKGQETFAWPFAWGRIHCPPFGYTTGNKNDDRYFLFFVQKQIFKDFLLFVKVKIWELLLLKYFVTLSG